jgi:PDZ domain
MKKNENKCLLLSLGLHVLAIYAMFLTQTSMTKGVPPKKMSLSEVTLDGGKKAGGGGKIIPISPLSGVKVPLKKNGFYGIGIYVGYDNSVLCEGIPYKGLGITGVVSGYPAERIGLRSGDVIVLIEGKSPSESGVDIKSETQSIVNFTICRNGRLINFSTEREFIYNE